MTTNISLAKQCYIPAEFHKLFDTKEKRIRMSTQEHDKEFVAKEILAVYYHYCVDANDDNNHIPVDISGLDVIECICVKLLVNPRHSYHIRGVMSNLHTTHKLIIGNRITLLDSLLILFTEEELIDYINS
jgi:hypothetical protein